MESSGGGKERKIELKMRFGREKEHNHTMDTIISNQGTISFIKKTFFFLTIVPFLRVMKIERFRMKRCFEEGEAVTTVITSLRECFLSSSRFTSIGRRGMSSIS